MKAYDEYTGSHNVIFDANEIWRLANEQQRDEGFVSNKEVEEADAALKSLVLPHKKSLKTYEGIGPQSEEFYTHVNSKVEPNSDQIPKSSNFSYPKDK